MGPSSVVSGEWEEGAVFLGTHHPRLDDKGRLFLPAKFRDELAGGLVITKGQEHCLYIWPQAEFDRVTGPLAGAAITGKTLRDFGRVLFAGASAETPDRQGRITLPLPLRAYAELTRDCVVTGAGNRAEIWDSQRYASWLAASEEAFAEVGEEVLPGVL